MFSSMQILMVMSIMVSFEVKGSKSSNKVGGPAHMHILTYVLRLHGPINLNSCLVVSFVKLNGSPSNLVFRGYK